MELAAAAAAEEPPGPRRLPPLPPPPPLPPFPAPPPQTNDSAQQNLPTSAGSTPLEHGTWRSRSWGCCCSDDDEGGGRDDDAFAFDDDVESENIASDAAGSSWSLLDKMCATRMPRWLLDAIATRNTTPRARNSASLLRRTEVLDVRIVRRRRRSTCSSSQATMLLPKRGSIFRSGELTVLVKPFVVSDRAAERAKVVATTEVLRTRERKRNEKTTRWNVFPFKKLRLLLSSLLLLSPPLSPPPLRQQTPILRTSHNSRQSYIVVV